jgi:lipopolysaccharide export system protein LptA
MMLHRQSKLLFSLLALLPAITWALPSDRNKPINIEADHAQLDDTAGVTQYKGRAVLTQGTLRIDGDIITFHYDDQKQLTKVVAQGKLAKYQQVQKVGEEPVKARALQMEYHAAAEKIYLFGQGHIRKSGDEFSGNRIEYDIKRNIVNANARPVTIGNKTEKTQGRVHIIINPNTQKISSKPKKAAPIKPKQLSSETNAVKPLIANDAQDTGYPTTRTLTQLNIRTGPGKQYGKLATLGSNSELIVLTQQNEWLQVRGLSNQKVVIGWIHRSYVSPNNF